MKLALEAGEHTHSLANEYAIHGITTGVGDFADGVGPTVEELRKKSLEVCQIGVFGYNPLGPPPDRDPSEVFRAIDIAAEINSVMETTRGGTANEPKPNAAGTRTRVPSNGPIAPVVVIPTASYSASVFAGTDRRNRSPEAIRTFAQSMEPLVAHAEDREVTLAIEPHIKAVINTPESFLALKKLLPSDRLRISFDITSFYGLDDLVDPEPIIRRGSELLRNHIGIVHLKELALTDEFHIHAGLTPIGNGPTDFAFLLHTIGDVLKTDMWVLIEHVLTYNEGVTTIQRISSILAGIT